MLFGFFVLFTMLTQDESLILISKKNQLLNIFVPTLSCPEYWWKVKGKKNFSQFG